MILFLFVSLFVSFADFAESRWSVDSESSATEAEALKWDGTEKKCARRGFWEDINHPN